MKCTSEYGHEPTQDKPGHYTCTLCGYGWWSSCGILRTFVVTHGTMEFGTGTIKMGRKETVTEIHNTPLFGDADRVHGVCRACRDGWEVPDNKFANEAERARALAAGKETK